MAFSFRFLFGFVACCLSYSAQAADTRLSQAGIELFVSSRNATQLRAFYSARGLPETALSEIAQRCFMGVVIHNKSPDTVWLDLDQWRFVSARGLMLARVQPADWRAAWLRMQLPLAAQATFGWTQLPITRDLQPDETVGGNIPLVATADEFTLIARFAIGSQNSARVVEIRVPHLRCARDETTP